MPLCTVLHMAKDPYAEDGRSNRERMLAGDFYIADDAENAALAQHPHDLPLPITALRGTIE